jgi:hypothetical protein
MNDDIQQADACARDDAGRRGHPELCCCLAIDENGKYMDTCYRPVMGNRDDRCRLFKRALNPTQTAGEA